LGESDDSSHRKPKSGYHYGQVHGCASNVCERLVTNMLALSFMPSFEKRSMPAAPNISLTLGFTVASAISKRRVCSGLSFMSPRIFWV